MGWAELYVKPTCLGSECPAHLGWVGLKILKKWLRHSLSPRALMSGQTVLSKPTFTQFNVFCGVQKNMQPGLIRGPQLRARDGSCFYCAGSCHASSRDNPVPSLARPTHKVK